MVRLWDSRQLYAVRPNSVRHVRDVFDGIFERSNYFDNLYDSMKSRMKAVILIDGYIAKY